MDYIAFQSRKRFTLGFGFNVFGNNRQSKGFGQLNYGLYEQFEFIIIFKFCTKTLSTFISVMGSDTKFKRELYPVPKSSIEKLTPSWRMPLSIS